jgi:Holliday junction resolvase RusA-like endonuclease
MRNFSNKELIKFRLETKPKPQARARVTRFCTYDPTHDYKTWLRWQLKEYFSTPFSGAVSLDITFLMPIPKSMSKKAREALKDDPRHIKRPDGKNLYSAVEDAMNEIAYVDDSIVWEFHVRKIYSEKPGMDITITGQNLEETPCKKKKKKK